MNNTLNKKKPIYKSFYLFLRLSVVFIILNLIIYSNNFSLSKFLLSTVISIFYCFFLGFGNSILALILDLRLDWVKETRKRLFYTIILSIIYISTICIAIDILTIYLFDDSNFHKILDITHIAKNTLIISISITLSAFFHAIGFMHQWKNSIKEKEKLKKQNILSRYEALKNQIDPHFFFNSLNTLSALIDENKDLSQKYIYNLSNIYRYILDKKDEELSKVNDEIIFTEKYIFLQKIRFENCINFNLKISTDFLKNKLILSLSLQIIIENIFKHNNIDNDTPISINISNNDDYLIIQNNINLKTNKVYSTKLGLKNIKSRYRFFTDKEIIVREENNIFTIKIPLLKHHTHEYSNNRR